MDDEQILARGGDENDIAEYAKEHGADLTEKDFEGEKPMNQMTMVVDIPEDITKNQYHILCALHYDSEICYNANWLIDGQLSKLTKKELYKEVKGLKDIGFVEFHRGLMNDDGEVAGSGWCWAYGNSEAIHNALDAHEKKHGMPTRKDNDY